MTLDDFATQYYFPVTKANVRENTYVGYVSSYNLYVKPKFGSVEMESITVSDVESWINQIERPGAANKAFMTLRQLLRKAADYDMYAGKDPAKCHIKLRKTSGNESKILTAEEVAQLLKAFKGHPLEACVICSVTLGLRRCESFGLKWQDIDMQTGAVHVRRSRQTVNGVERVYDPKTKKSNRVCYLPDFAVKRLSKIKKEESSWILPVPVDKAAAMYKYHCNKCNVPYTPFMNLRHTWATLLAQNNVDIVFIANMLGHIEIDMAYKRYIKPTEESYKQVQKVYSSIVCTSNSYVRKLVTRIKEKASALASLVSKFNFSSKLKIVGA